VVPVLRTGGLARFADEGQAGAIFGRVQVQGCDGGVARGADGFATGDPARRASDDDRGLEAPGHEGLVWVFSGEAEAREGTREEALEQPHAKIGQLMVDQDFLTKASGR